MAQKIFEILLTFGQQWFFATAIFSSVLLTGCLVRPSQPGATFPAGTGSLHILVAGLRNDNGQTIVSLFAGKKGFPEDVDSSLTTSTAPIVEGHSDVFFHDIPYGTYAVSVLHDEDFDGNMATSLFGIPLEGYGISGHPDYRFGKPDFENAKFLFLAPERNIELDMHYGTARKLHQQAAREARQSRNE